MRARIRSIAASAVAAGLLSVVPMYAPAAHANTLVGINIESSKGALSIPTSCAITNTVRSNCSAAISAFSGSVAAGYPCTATMIFALGGGGGTTGPCHFDNGAGVTASGVAGTLTAGITTTGTGCTTVTINRTGALTDTLTFRDPSLARWKITGLYLKGVTYTHTAEGDSWTLDSSSTLQATNDGRTLTVALSGAIRATSNCSAGIAASNLNFDLAGQGTISG